MISKKNWNNASKNEAFLKELSLRTCLFLGMSARLTLRFNKPFFSWTTIGTVLCLFFWKKGDLKRSSVGNNPKPESSDEIHIRWERINGSTLFLQMHGDAFVFYTYM